MYKSHWISTILQKSRQSWNTRQSCQTLHQSTEELGLTRVNEFDVMSEIAGIWEETVSSPEYQPLNWTSSNFRMAMEKSAAIMFPFPCRRAAINLHPVDKRIPRFTLSKTSAAHFALSRSDHSVEVRNRRCWLQANDFKYHERNNDKLWQIDKYGKDCWQSPMKCS